MSQTCIDGIFLYSCKTVDMYVFYIHAYIDAYKYVIICNHICMNNVNKSPLQYSYLEISLWLILIFFNLFVDDVKF